MNLAIDIGNTRIKAGLFEGKELRQVLYFSQPEELIQHPGIRNAQKAIIGSVVNGHEPFYQQLQTLMPLTLFTTQSRIPLHNHYKSASTLGSDRLAASVGAYYLYPNQPVLVIDCGTCIKYNFTTAANEYLGGAISPGIAMRFKALHEHTSKLPLLSADANYTALIGDTTEHSLQSGVMNGALAEIEGFITQYKQQYTGTICVLTGGDSEYFAKRLKNPIFVHQNLVLKGLNDILIENSEQP